MLTVDIVIELSTLLSYPNHTHSALDFGVPLDPAPYPRTVISQWIQTRSLADGFVGLRTLSNRLYIHQGSYSIGGHRPMLDRAITITTVKRADLKSTSMNLLYSAVPLFFVI